MKSHKEVTKQYLPRHQGFSYYFCLMIEGYRYGSGSVPLANGSGSRTAKNICIRILLVLEPMRRIPKQRKLFSRWWTRCGSARCGWRRWWTSRVVVSSWRTTTAAAGRRDSGATRSRRSYTPSAGHAGRIGEVLSCINSSFLGPKWHSPIRSMPFHRAQKTLEFQGPTPPTCPPNEYARIHKL
jgi:hypothetical protein